VWGCCNVCGAVVIVCGAVVIVCGAVVIVCGAVVIVCGAVDNGFGKQKVFWSNFVIPQRGY
jgi:hypothetical protein